MKQYFIPSATLTEDLTLASPSWAKAAPTPLSTHLWSETYPTFHPSTFQAIHTPEAIHVRLHSSEFPITARIQEEGGPVHLDSCLEFFWSPDNTKPDYFNFEFNPSGILHVKLGPDRHHRSLFPFDKSLLCVESAVSGAGIGTDAGIGAGAGVGANDEAGWTICFCIPFSLLHELGITPTLRSRANFYKCGDETPAPHFASWNPVTSPTPDFHRPIDFGELIFKD